MHLLVLLTLIVTVAQGASFMLPLPVPFVCRIIGARPAQFGRPAQLVVTFVSHSEGCTDPVTKKRALVEADMLREILRRQTAMVAARRLAEQGQSIEWPQLTAAMIQRGQDDEIPGTNFPTEPPPEDQIDESRRPL